MIILVADLEEFGGDPNKKAEGVVIESHIDAKRGTCATLIIKDGVLSRGEFVVAGESIAPTRLMEDFQGKSIQEARFGSAVRVVGFNSIPDVGAPFRAVTTRKEAEKIVRETISRAAESDKPETKKTRSKKYHDQGRENEDTEKTVIPVIIKADMLGCVEAIKQELEKLKNDRVDFKIVHSGVGAISENDIRTAGGNKDIVVIGFNVDVGPAAAELAKQAQITLRTFDVIYKLTEWIENLAAERVPRRETEKIRGMAKILKAFSSAKDKHVVGGEVIEGTISLGEDVKIFRRDAEIGRGKIIDLQQQKVKTKTVEAGNQFGVQIQSKIAIAPGDRIESFVITEE
jgi:translation initiation factor IF-2